jgi:hypothetical protein
VIVTLTADSKVQHGFFKNNFEWRAESQESVLQPTQTAALAKTWARPRFWARIERCFSNGIAASHSYRKTRPRAGVFFHLTLSEGPFFYA